VKETEATAGEGVDEEEEEEEEEETDRADNGGTCDCSEDTCNCSSLSIPPLLIEREGGETDDEEEDDEEDEEEEEAGCFDRARDDFMLARRFAKLRPSSKSSEIRNEEEG
jgi:hypothetical protein